MNKIVTQFLLCATVVAAVSCNNDTDIVCENSNEHLTQMSFRTVGVPNYDNETADTLKNAPTRTSLEADQTQVTWNANDVIAIGYKGSTAGAVQPFTTPTTASDVRFWGQAPDNKAPYFMMYPYQNGQKIEVLANKKAKYTYSIPKTQTAIAGTFDPKVNFAVGIIPQEYKPFVAYNLCGLLQFSFHGVSNVAQIKLISRGLEALAGDVSTEVEFKDNGTIGTANSTFVANTQTGIVNYVPASGTMAENTNYFVVLPTGKLASGLTLVFILTDGKSLQVKLNDAVNIERAKRYDLGNIALNASKAKVEILSNKGLIESVKLQIRDLELNPDGTLDIYKGNNLEKILSLKGNLNIAYNDNITSLDGLQYFRNVTDLNIYGNKNLAGNIDLSKYKQLTGSVEIQRCPAVTKVDATGLDINTLKVHDMDGVKEVVTRGNKKLEALDLYSNKVLEGVDVSNLPVLKEVRFYSSPRVKTVNTSNAPELRSINAASVNGLESMTGLDDNVLLQDFVASYTKLKKLDFSKQTKLRTVNIAFSDVTEIKGLASAGENLLSLQLARSHVGTLDVSHNPNLQMIDVYAVKEITTLDVRNNLKLTKLRTSLASNLSELKLGNNVALQELKVSHCKFTTLDIRKFTRLTTFYAGSQSPNGFVANIVVTMTAQQKAKFGDIFRESAFDGNANYENTNSYVKVVVQ